MGHEWHCCITFLLEMETRHATQPALQSLMAETALSTLAAEENVPSSDDWKEPSPIGMNPLPHPFES